MLTDANLCKPEVGTRGVLHCANPNLAEYLLPKVPYLRILITHYSSFYGSWNFANILGALVLN